ncbi:MAG: hypothetical protein R3F13_02200 [Prosthecobacter sp.]
MFKKTFKAIAFSHSKRTRPSKMNPRRTPALAKLLGKIRTMMIASPDAGPHRSWDSAATREIQLEFEFRNRSPSYSRCVKNGTLGSVR